MKRLLVFGFLLLSAFFIVEGVWGPLFLQEHLSQHVCELGTPLEGTNIYKKMCADEKPQGACSQEEIRLVLETAQIAPTRADGSCWDPCPKNQDGSGLLSFVSNSVGAVLDAKHAPDPYVVLEVHQKKYRSNIITDQFRPRWSQLIGPSIRIGDEIDISVYDLNLKPREDTHIGRKSVVLNRKLLAQKRLVLKNFGGVKELVFVIQKKRYPQPLKAGSYNIFFRIEASSHKPTGERWDPIWGPAPDLQAELRIGTSLFTTQKFNNQYNASWSKEFTFSSETTGSITIFDKDLTAHDLIGACKEIAFVGTCLDSEGYRPPMICGSALLNMRFQPPKNAPTF